MKTIQNRHGFSIFIVIGILLALTILVVAFLRKSGQQAAWAIRYVQDQAALEAALAGIAAAEDRLQKGRWYSSESPRSNHGSFGAIVDRQSGSSVFVVCQDYYSRIAIQNGEYETSKGKVKISTPKGYFHVLHSVGVFAKGTCGNMSKFIFARFLVSPGPLAYGGSMEGIRITRNGRHDEYPYDDLVCATWNGEISGAERVFVSLPTSTSENVTEEPSPVKWKYRIQVSEEALFSKGQILYIAERSGVTIHKKAIRDGKVVKVLSPSGDGDSDEPIMIIQDLNYFESSGHTLKKMVRRTLIPDSQTGTGNLSDKTGCREIIRGYVNSLNATYLNHAETVFADNTVLGAGAITDSEATAIAACRTIMTEIEFIQKMLPQFIPPGLSATDRLDFLEKAAVVLDKVPPSTADPTPDEQLIHEHYLGPWPSDKTKNALVFSQPRAIWQMLDFLRPEAAVASIGEFIQSSTVLKMASYKWDCDYRGPSGGVDTTWNIPPGGEWIHAGGKYYLVYSQTGQKWEDNAYDLEYNGKRIRMSDVALFLHKLVSDDGEIGEEGGPEFPLISDVQASKEQDGSIPK